MQNTGLMHRSTAEAMVEAYERNVAQVRLAYSMLVDAQADLNKAFMVGELTHQDFRLLPSGHRSAGGDRATIEGAEAIIEAITRKAWSRTYDYLNIRQFLSLKRQEEFEKELESGKLPEFTVGNIMASFENARGSLGTYMEEAVLEVFNFLRPSMTGYKRNEAFQGELGNKIVLYWGEAANKWGWRVGVNHYRSNDLRQLDRVFHLLDGKELPKETGYYGPFYSDIDRAGREDRQTGETAYFRWKAFRNGNIHIEFLRPDLVTQINRIAGGKALKNAAA